jgi:UDP-N-acetylglucosamine 2-epimerase (non-hydrolysing)
LADAYAVVTIHRPANVDDEPAAGRIVAMLDAIAERIPVVLPLHPRGRPSLERAGLQARADLRVIEPLGYVDFVSLLEGAAIAITDSGGIQEETTMLGIPCLTVRPNTERPITISHGTNRLVEPDAVPGAVDAILGGRAAMPSERPPLWDGQAGQRIAEIVVGWLRGDPG